MSYDIKEGQVWEYKSRKDHTWSEIPADCQSNPEALEHAEGACFRIIKKKEEGGSLLLYFLCIKSGYIHFKGVTHSWTGSIFDDIIDNNQLRLLYSLSPQKILEKKLKTAKDPREMISIMEENAELFGWPREEDNPDAFVLRQERFAKMIETYGSEHEKELMDSLSDFAEKSLSGKMPQITMPNDEWNRMLSLIKKALSGDEYANLSLAKMMSNYPEILDTMSETEKNALEAALIEKSRRDIEAALIEKNRRDIEGATKEPNEKGMAEEEYDMGETDKEGVMEEEMSMESKISNLIERIEKLEMPQSSDLRDNQRAYGDLQKEIRALKDFQQIQQIHNYPWFDNSYGKLPTYYK